MSEKPDVHASDKPEKVTPLEGGSQNPVPQQTPDGLTQKRDQSVFTKKKPQFKTKKKQKQRRKRIIIAVIVTVAVLGLSSAWLLPKFLGSGNGQYDPTAVYSGDLAVVTREDVTKTVKLNGVLQSSQSMVIYSTVNAKVSAVDVKLGDRVGKGQRLAQLDTSELNQELKSQSSSLQETQISKVNEAASAQDAYEQALNAYNSNMNPEILAAEKGVKAAQAEYGKASRAFQTMLRQKQDGTLDTLVSAENAVREAYQAVESAAMGTSHAEAILKDADKLRSMAAANVLGDRTDLALYQEKLRQKEAWYKANPSADLKQQIEELNERIFEVREALKQSEAAASEVDKSWQQSWSEKNQSKLTLSHEKENLGLARRAYREALRQVDVQLMQAQEVVNETGDAVTEAKVSLQAAKNTAVSQLKESQRALQAAQSATGAGLSAAQSTISKLRADIGSATVTAPISGIVTQVGAKVGFPPEGALMTVEDDKNLVIKTSVKESDVAKITVGSQVTFTTAASEKKEFSGVVSFVSPTASSGGEVSAPEADAGRFGSVDDASSLKATFPVEITVTGDVSGLRLGSTAKAKVVVEGQRNVLAVAKSAVIDAMIPLGGSDSEGGQAESESGKAVEGSLTAESGSEQFPKSILVAEDAGSNKIKVKELPVTVLVESGSLVAIKGQGVEEGLQVVNNAQNYLHLVDQTANLSDTPVVMPEDGEL